MADKIAATIIVKGRTKDVTVGVNGVIHKYPVNVETSLFPAEKEALENAGYQVVAASDNSTAGAEGSASAVDQGPDNNRTEPHQGDQQDGDAVLDGEDKNPADNALVGGDEPDPKVHSVAGDGTTGSTHPLDRDGDGQPGGSKAANPPALTGKTTAQLEEIAAAEGVTFGDDVKTNPDRIEAIEKARAAKA